MISRVCIPQPPLSDFVDYFWLHDNHAPLHPRERILPTATVDLVLNLHGGPLRLFDRQSADQPQSFCGPVICGPRSQFFTVDTTRPTSILGVRFKSGCRSPFPGLPASELHNAFVGLKTLWGPRADELHERLLAAETAEGKFRIMEGALLRQIFRVPSLHRAVAFALEKFQDVSHGHRIAAITEQIGLSQQRFSQVFREAVGLMPKLFCRVRRFQQVLSLAAVMELKNRGVEDILMACADGLKGFPQAIEPVFPRAEVQLCVVRLARNSLRYGSREDREAVAADLKLIQQAAAEVERQSALFEEEWAGTTR